MPVGPTVVPRSDRVVDRIEGQDRSRVLRRAGIGEQDRRTRIEIRARAVTAATLLVPLLDVPDGGSSFGSTTSVSCNRRPLTEQQFAVTRERSAR